MLQAEQFLELENITKSYGGVKALTDVRFRASGGSIHAILGENGAGKSTLMKVLAGVVSPDTGLLRLENTELKIASPTEAARHGIICIFQELSIIPHLTVAENICLSDPPLNRLGLIDGKEQTARARKALDTIGCGGDINLDARCGDLPLSQRQLVEIAKAVARKPKLLILDEATSALTASDVEPIMNLLRRLRDEGMCILFISHRMHEIDALADTCSVFRNGELVQTFATGARSNDEIVQMMVGKPISSIYPDKRVEAPTTASYLSVENLSWNNQLNDVTLDVKPGEIVGLGGLDGQGQRELLLAVSGVLSGINGRINVDGKEVNLSGPKEAKSDQTRIALIPEDRKTEGLFLSMSVSDNLVATVLESLRTGFRLSKKREIALADELVARLKIKTANLESEVGTLSGGNQQKVVIAKWLATEPRLLLLMDPTRGIDVGTKQEIYKLFRELADQGMAVLFYSTDYDELIGLCDRALIMYDGRITAHLSGDDLNEHNILSSALNLSSKNTKQSGTRTPVAEK